MAAARPGGAFFQRLLASAVTVLGVVTLVFVAVRAAPGDPVEAILGEYAEESEVQALRARLHLDEPLHTQYAIFLGSILDGSLGTSYEARGTPRTVSARIWEVFPATLDLALAGLLLAVLIATPLGLAAALRRDTWVDGAAMALAIAGVALPVIWLGPFLIFVFAVRLHVFPVPGEAITGPLHLVLPGLVLGAALAGKLARILRAAALDALRSPAVVLARGRGLKERVVLARYVVHHSLIPVVTVLGMQMAALLGGAILTEKIFSRPGIGTLLLDGIARRDYDLVQGSVIFIALTYVIVNLAVDLLYLVIDPRIRREG